METATGEWGGARENSGRRAVYRGKIHLPWNVRITHAAHARLRAIRQLRDISVGDLVEYLIWNPPVQTFERRPSGGADVKKYQTTFRVSVACDARLRQLMRVNGVSGGDVVEALILSVPATCEFPSKWKVRGRDSAHA